jgi:4a-hydroxytetrahydrobiopterin dehydratase
VREKLSDLEVRRALAALPGWTRRGDTLSKTFQRRTFVDAIKLVNRVAEEAESRNHHPDIDIRYSKLTFGLSTHDAGGITKADLELGAAIEKLASSGG